MIEERMTLVTEDNVELEARWDEAVSPRMAVVFCHAHPLQGGTMHSPLIVKVTEALVDAGFSVLRFNFRGVGASAGSWGGGGDELADVSAAMAEAGRATISIGLAGWSFGAATALRWQSATADTATYCGIAPPVVEMPTSEQLAPATRTIIMGERDQLIDFEASRVYATSINATFVPMSTDHFFYYREDRVADTMIETFSGSPGAPDAPP